MADLFLLAIVAMEIYIVATTRLGAAVRACVVLGALLGAVPIALAWGSTGAALGHALLIGIGSAAVKALLLPWLLLRAIRLARVRREAEPFVSLHASLLAGTALVGLSFWMARSLALPRPAPSALIVPVAFSSLWLGFLMLVVRRKAISQVIAYLVLEDGVYLFGLALAADMPLVVEIGILLDVLVGVLVMGIAIHQISREFDHIDTASLADLKD
jgi:hydrogenase-4 component E